MIIEKYKKAVESINDIPDHIRDLWNGIVDYYNQFGTDENAPEELKTSFEIMDRFFESIGFIHPEDRKDIDYPSDEALINEYNLQGFYVKDKLNIVKTIHDLLGFPADETRILNYSRGKRAFIISNLIKGTQYSHSTAYNVLQSVLTVDKLRK